MRLIGVLLILLGIVGVIMGAMMFGDIGIACIVGALSGLLSGFGFLSADKRLKNMNDYSGRSAHALKRVQRMGIAV